MSDEENWDTSEIAEQSGDDFNVSGFNGQVTDEQRIIQDEQAVVKGESFDDTYVPSIGEDDNGLEDALEEEVLEDEVFEEEVIEEEPERKPSLMKRLSDKFTRKKAPAVQKATTSGGGGKAFTELLDQESLEFFNEVCSRPFSQQAIAFLDAYWEEVSSQAEFIFGCSIEVFKYADMHTKGINYIHLYDEGCDLDFTFGLYFYEKLHHKIFDEAEGKKWRNDETFAMSLPDNPLMTAMVRKKELRDKVDVNFDGRISFLEYLLYQYKDFANPAEFIQRRRKIEEGTEEIPEIEAARLALERVNNAIREYEKERRRLEEAAKLPGVKGLKAKHQLSMLDAGTLAEELNVALIKAEAAVRLATKKYKNGTAQALAGQANAAISKATNGSIWWLNRDMKAKKERYGKKSRN